jgi:hypothetical protein
MQRLLAGFARTTERSISTSQFLLEPPEQVPEWRVWSPHAAEPRRAPQTTPSRARTLRQSLLRRAPLRSPPEGRLFGSSDASARVRHQGWSRVGNRSTSDPRVEFPFGPKLQEVTQISRAEGLPIGHSGRALALAHEPRFSPALSRLVVRRSTNTGTKSTIRADWNSSASKRATARTIDVLTPGPRRATTRAAITSEDRSTPDAPGSIITTHLSLLQPSSRCTADGPTDRGKGPPARRSRRADDLRVRRGGRPQSGHHVCQVHHPGDSGQQSE